MKLHFYGGTKAVSGSNYLLEAGGKKILIDCGLFQGTRDFEKRNNEPFAYDPRQIDCVIITHAHLDHIGRLPMLAKAGFSGRIFATAPTIDFTRLMLEDSKKILLEKARHADAIPFFGADDIDKIMGLFVATDYHKPVKISNEISFEFFDAGHILGSAFIKLKVKSEKLKDEKMIVFSGDLGNKGVALLKDPEVIAAADYVLIESAYGDRLHEAGGEAKNIIEDTVEETVAKKGILLIPSFAMERTQQILFHLNELVEHKRIPPIPVFLDSPLAVQTTAVYEKYKDDFDDEAKEFARLGDDVFSFPGLKFTPTVKESKAINNIAPPKIIIAGSGMSQGGRIVHHEARYLSLTNCTLLFVTYQAQGTLGRRILEGAKEVEILDQKIAVRAKTKSISIYSAHADQKGLLEWLGAIQKPIKKVFVVQGEEKPAEALAQEIRDKMGVDARAPEFGETVELE